MDPRLLETNIKGFFDKDAHEFVVELWGHLISAEENGGIPQKFTESAKQKVIKKIVRKIHSIISININGYKTLGRNQEIRRENKI